MRNGRTTAHVSRAHDPRPLLLANARVIDPSRGADFHGDVFLADGVVKDAGFGIAAAGIPDGAEVVECGGAVVAPGLVDMRAFVGEPGAEHRETLASASHAAAAGGVTTIICQPDTDPAVDDPAIVDFILRRARDTAVVRVHPMAAITKGLEGHEMTEIGLLQAAGAVAFTDGHKSIMNAQVLRRALTYARDFDALLVHHTEDASMSQGAMNEGAFASRLGLSGNPKAAETIILERDVRLVGAARSRYHAAALTCAESLEVLERAKAAGLPVTASVSINHLSFNELDIGAYRTYFRLAPPLRGEEDRQALIRALASGLLDVVVSDHLPQDVEGKRLPFSEAEPGAIGLETLLSAALRLVHSDQVDLVNLLAALSTRPAQILGLDAGTLRPGAAADVIVFDPGMPYVLDPRSLKSRCRNTPFDEARLDGRVLRTIVAGQTVYEYV
ncbi:dihydroorotase [Xanthobacter flavus]|uniref:Dihydroorotase n=1 Tax=Xanthobacter flavus TaxID=281 RepID=A0A9W6CKW6_XANFL|nr:dihydroorotase [Xanthobacter flavus]MDR6331986.1 dihydroorotase [Xanthobacter flavus]GLI22270.1 dihydroorotase [Xanthobacter flavus]